MATILTPIIVSAMLTTHLLSVKECKEKICDDARELCRNYTIDPKSIEKILRTPLNRHLKNSILYGNHEESVLFARSMIILVKNIIKEEIKDPVEKEVLLSNFFMW